MRRLAPLLLLALALAACDSGGSGLVEADSTVTVAYVGTLEDGTVFDQSAGTSFSLGGVVVGFREGLIGMAVGETKTFDVPPEKGYGSTPRYRNGVLVIPANSTLTFEVTVLDIQ